MLAGKVELEKLEFPAIASPKLDGVRCLLVDGCAVSRALKPIPNAYVRGYLERCLPEGADGELTVGEGFGATTSGVMSDDGMPDFTYHMFDIAVSGVGYVERAEMMAEWAQRATNRDRVQIVPTVIVRNSKELLAYEKEQLLAGFEGVMVRSTQGHYKHGRSTTREGLLLKLKRFDDGEAVVEGFEEMMHNGNEAVVNELGLSKRSSSKSGKEPAGTLGKLLVRDLTSGVRFAIGTGVGLDSALRARLWAEREQLPGRVVRYRYQAHGTQTAPRLPLFDGFRSVDDLTGY